MTESTARAAVVRFRVPGDLLQVDAGNLELARHDRVLVETERGTMVATVLLPPELSNTERPLFKVLRRLSEEDANTSDRNSQRESEALEFCRKRIRSLDLPMKVVGVELTQSATRATFYFTSAHRVDFRALVKDLARRFHTRIEMRQIGVRDAARHTGGTGSCGRELCCSTWLPEFKPISIRMAKDQNLALHQEGLSGLCGRLRCCLLYEHELYKNARKGLPKQGARVLTPRGEGRVQEVNVLQRRIRVAVGNSLEEFDAHLVERKPAPGAPVATDASPKKRRKRRKKTPKDN